MTPFGRTLSLVLAWSAMGAASGFAQQANVPVSANDWRVECTNVGKTLDCRALVEVMQRDSRQVITSLTVRYPAETKKPVMMVQVPLGVLVNEPIALTVDTNQPVQTSVQTCTQAGCFAGSPISDVLISTMRVGKQLTIVFYNANKQAITVTVPLAGFAMAYDKIKS
jgi:invasion protein IalB